LPAGAAEKSAEIRAALFPDLGRQGGALVEEEDAGSQALVAGLALTQVRQQAHQFLLKARREAEALRTRALGEAEAVRETARREGLEAGRTAAYLEWQERFSSLASAMESASQEWARLREDFRREGEAQLPSLVVLLAKKVIQREISLGGPTILGMVRAALERLGGEDGEVTLWLAPQDLESLHGQRETFLKEFPGLRTIRFEADPLITPGGCLVETERGLVDARLETQLEEAARILEGNP